MTDDVDDSVEFWPPPGLLTVACWVLAVFDVSMLSIVVRGAFFR